MTNREAIKILKIEREHMTPTVFAERIEAINMAISALEAQELNCVVCVYREAADQSVDPCIRWKRNCIDYWKGEEE